MTVHATVWASPYDGYPLCNKYQLRASVRLVKKYGAGYYQNRSVTCQKCRQYARKLR